MKTSKPAIAFVTSIQNMARTLEDVGEKISEASIIAKILGSLPLKYSNLVTAWDSVDSDKKILIIYKSG